MSAGVQVRGWSGPSRRRVPRYDVRTPLEVTVLRSGVPDTVPGRLINLCERGVAAMLAGELRLGEVVGVEVSLPLAHDSLRTRAMVRYQDKLRCGLEFVGLSVEQRAAIREWAKGAKGDTVILSVSPPFEAPDKIESGGPLLFSSGTAVGLPADLPPGDSRGTAPENSPDPPRQPRKKSRGFGWMTFLVFAAIAGAVGWWRWNRGWAELESGLKTQQTLAAETPQAQLPAEAMQKLLVHRVEPVYPYEARAENLEGTIALDVVVGRDGSVIRVRALNGPDVLARAAADALRWWKFEPYLINGEPATVETTVAVEFKR
jgi:TonB family protein